VGDLASCSVQDTGVQNLEWEWISCMHVISRKISMGGLMDMFVYTFVELDGIFMDMVFVAEIATVI
jgi:hypothetical protein